jgi:hypothetical protein
MPHVSQRRSEFTGSYTPHVQAPPRRRGARFWVETVLLIALVIGMGIRAYMKAAAHNARVCASFVCE